MKYFNSFVGHFTIALLPWVIAGWVFVAKPQWVGFMYVILVGLSIIHAHIETTKEENEGNKK